METNIKNKVMKKLLVLSLLLSALTAQADIQVQSPSGTLSLTIGVDAGKPFYRVAKGTHDVISPSLLGIKYKRRKDRQPKSVPVGFERQVTMHSLSFREYLWAKGWDDARIDVLRPYFERREKVPEAVNETFHRLLREYAVVGGMPEVVSGFVDEPHFGDVQRAQEKLVASCIDDIHKYAEAPEVQKIEQCYRAIPRILAKENKKFKYSEVDKSGSARKYLASVEWLRDAALASFAECVEADRKSVV